MAIDKPKATPSEDVESQTVAPEETKQNPSEGEETPASQMPSDEQKRSELPEDASERTREQFEKLKASNQKLKQELERTAQGDSVFDSFRNPKQSAPVQSGQSVAEPQSSASIEEDGSVDINKLNATLTDAQQRALRAEQRASQTEERIMRFEETRQAEDAHKEYPQLDPAPGNDKFDSNFFDLVKDRLLSNMYSGKQETLVQAAKNIANVYKGTENVGQAKEEAVKEFKQSQSQTEHGPVEVGQGESRQTKTDTEDLRTRTRMGDKNALKERLDNYHAPAEE